MKPVILQYHKVQKSFDWSGTWVTPRQFLHHIKSLKRLKLTSFRKEDVESFLTSKGKKPTNTVLITFDDGFNSVYKYAYPTLKKDGFIGFVFVVAGYIGKENSWDASFGKHSRHLSCEEIIELNRNGWIIGSHTMTHPDLRKLTPKEIEFELRQSKQTLEDIINEEVFTLSYPYGLFNYDIKDMVRKTGYKLAFCSKKSLREPKFDPFAIERRGIYIIDHLLPLKLQAHPFGTLEMIKEIFINRFALLSSLARHNSLILRRISRMDM